MKATHRLFKHGKFFYAEDRKTGKQKSLRTTDRGEAERLLAAKNEAANDKNLALAVGQIYLAAIDPAHTSRTWADVIRLMVERGGPNTQARTTRAFESCSFAQIRRKAIHETTSTDFLEVLKDKRKSTIHYLRLLQSMAANLGWLHGRTVLPRQCWPKIVSKPKRAITWDEHQQIMAAEKNTERRLFYEVLWEIGSGQSDAAKLTRDNIRDGVLAYQREKTRTQATIKIGARLASILKQLPEVGSLFPRIGAMNSVARSAEFHRRCRLLDITGVSLHSYRYAWAERAFSLGYPERFAQAALGHESPAIHHAYARKAKVCCPSLDEFERNRPGI